MRALLVSGMCAVLVLFPFWAVAEEAASTTVASNNSGIASTSSTSTVAVIKPLPPSNTNVEKMVRAYFADIPVMIKIAECESKFRQYTDSGNVLHGGYGSSMIGIFQFSDNMHRSGALARGYDIDTPEGNIAYARYIYKQEGTTPWISSFSCWNTGGPEASTRSSSTNNSNDALNKDLSFGMVDQQVLTLQQLLNKAGYIIATEGPGSVGNETNKFGALTRAAVRSFQCEKSISCSGDEYTTGYGFVGARTRSALLGAKASEASPPAKKPTFPSSSSSSSNSSNSSKNAAQIAQLEAQISMYQTVINSLTKQINALKSQ